VSGSWHFVVPSDFIVGFTVSCKGYLKLYMCVFLLTESQFIWSLQALSRCYTSGTILPGIQE